MRTLQAIPQISKMDWIRQKIISYSRLCRTKRVHRMRIKACAYYIAIEHDWIFTKVLSASIRPNDFIIGVGGAEHTKGCFDSFNRDKIKTLCQVQNYTMGPIYRLADWLTGWVGWVGAGETKMKRTSNWSTLIPTSLYISFIFWGWHELAGV